MGNGTDISLELNMIKTFETSGPCQPELNYMIPPLVRFPVLPDLIDNNRYFVLHSPRQTGKTTLLLSMADQINKEGRYYSFVCPLSFVINAKNELETTSKIMQSLEFGLSFSTLPALNELHNRLPPFSLMTNAPPITSAINFICNSLDKELVLFFDEADCIPSESILSFLSQIREGYNFKKWSGKHTFPRTIGLIGLRDLHDYRFKDNLDSQRIIRQSPFSIHRYPLEILNLSFEQINSLYKQHTDASGQFFTKSAVERVWHWSSGQPWLVNVLASDIIQYQLGNDYSIPITDKHVDIVANGLILRNEVHLSNLVDRLKEPRVRKVMALAFSSQGVTHDDVLQSDIKYCVDLGLLKLGKNGIGDCFPANQIYNEVIVRALSSMIIADPTKIPLNTWTDENDLDMSGLLRAFQDYWLENSALLFNDNKEDFLIEKIIEEILSENNNVLQTGNVTTTQKLSIRRKVDKLISEAFCVLVLCAFLQRVLNGGAESIKREFAVGLKFVDICVTFKQKRYPIEAKIKGSVTIEQGIRQLSGYINRYNASEGWLIEFDRGHNKSPKQKLSFKTYKIGKNIVYALSC
jgi:hypothetical protein